MYNFVQHLLTFKRQCDIIVIQNRKGSECILIRCCLTGILGMAALGDCAGYLVYNGIIIAGWSEGLLFSVYYRGVSGIFFWLSSVVISIIIFFLMFRFKIMGAGDVKLLSVISGFMGIEFAVRSFVAAVIVGSILSIIKCIQYGYLADRLSYFRQYITDLILTKKSEPYYIRERDGDTVVIPFSVAIAIGYLAVDCGFTNIIRL